MADHKTGPGKRLQNETPRARAERTLHGWLTDGTLGSGERLPTEQVLADRVGVSRTTLRAVLAHFADQGLIERPANRRGWLVKKQSPPETAIAPTRNVAMIAPSYLPGHCRRQLDLFWVEHVGLLTAQHLYTQGYHVTRLHPGPGILPKGLNPGGFCALLVISDDEQPPAVGDLIRSFRAKDVPVVVLSDHCREPVGVHGAGPDFQQAAFDMTQWLLARGHRRILPCWTINVNQLPPASLQRRMNGYRDAMQQAGLPALPATVVHLLLPTPEWPAGEDVAARLVGGHLAGILHSQEGLDAVLVTSDCAAAIVQHALAFLLGRDRNQVEVASLGRVGGCRACENHELPAATMDLKLDNIVEHLIQLLVSPPSKPTRRMIVPSLHSQTSARQEADRRFPHE